MNDLPSHFPDKLKKKLSFYSFDYYSVVYLRSASQCVLTFHVLLK